MQLSHSRSSQSFSATHSIRHLCRTMQERQTQASRRDLTQILLPPYRAPIPSMTLASNIVNSTEYLPNGYTCFTVDVSTPAQEYICGTVTGSTSYGLLDYGHWFAAWYFLGHCHYHHFLDSAIPLARCKRAHYRLAADRQDCE